MATRCSIPAGKSMDRGAWQATVHWGRKRVKYNLAAKQTDRHTHTDMYFA